MASNLRKLHTHLLFLHFVTVMVLGGGYLQHPRIPEEELEALLQFKAGLSPSSQRLLKGWDAHNSQSICGGTHNDSWVGLRCHGHHIHSLNLHSFGLAGSLSPYLGNLSFLTVLDLSENFLTGHIPWELSYCVSLRLLNLNQSRLSGHIPPSLSSLPSLEIFQVCVNNLTGLLPPGFLSNMSTLTVLTVCENALTGSIPEHIASPRLQELHLWRNHFSGVIPRSLGNCTHLTQIKIRENSLTGYIPSELGLLSRLQRLSLGYNDFTPAPIPRSLGNCTELVWLALLYDNLTGPIPRELSNLHQLQHLILGGNQISGGLDVLNFNNLTELHGIDFSTCELSGPIPEQLCNSHQPEYIDFSRNSFSGKVRWEVLSNCSNLYYLDLSENQLVGSVNIGILGMFRGLQHLYLQDNLLQGGLETGDVSRFLVPSLLDIDLSHNRLNGSLPSAPVHAFQGVVDISFSDNLMSGPLPSWLGELVNVQTMNFSNNYFVGSIPDGLGNCIGLVSLNLSHNLLSAELPWHLSNLTYLQTLDLSINNLTGALPSFLESLPHLRFLNVSFNNFSGPVPLDGAFKHLNASFFQGNPSLCGPIIHKTCMELTSKRVVHHKKGYLVISLTCVSIGLVALALLVTCYFCYQKTVVPPTNLLCTIRGKIYTLEELAEATSGYCEKNILGQGGMAVVYKGVLPNGEVVAVKKLKQEMLHLREAFMREMNLISKLKHRNLVQILGWVVHEEAFGMVLEYMPNGSLGNFLSHGNLSWEMFIRVVIGVANALAYLHHEQGMPIVHGDVKPANILLDSDLEPHLADFGIAKVILEGSHISLSSSLKGSIGYMAPEYAYATHVSTKADVYSFGVILLEMMTGKKPTQEVEDGCDSLHEWVKLRIHAGVELKDVLQELLMQDILAHPEEGTLINSGANNNNGNEGVALALIRMAIECTHEQPNNRPTMLEVGSRLFYLTQGYRISHLVDRLRIITY